MLKRLHNKGLPESAEQAIVVAVLRAAGVLVASVPNEASRGKRGFAAMGLLSGMPDLLVITPAPNRPDVRMVAIEMKRTKGGVVSAEQKRVHTKLKACGWEVRVCRGHNEAFEFLDELGYPVPQTFRVAPKSQKM